MTDRPSLLITAGPTHEPIDAVRAIVNRSSGRLGCELADHAARHGWDVHILLGPTPIEPTETSVVITRFQTTAELQSLLNQNLTRCDVLVMAAAVADYRPVTPDADTKFRRGSGELVLKLEPTSDLLAACSSSARAEQLLVGFALEPAARLAESARDKLHRKGVHAIVANPLETMDSPDIEATLFGAPGSGFAESETTPGRVSKGAFAAWLLERIERARDVRREERDDA